VLFRSAQGAPGPPAGTPEQQQGAARQARTQAAQQAAPTLRQGQPAPATQPGAEGNSTKFSTLVQDGSGAMNRVIDQGVVR
jgi:hypothetical protein